MNSTSMCLLSINYCFHLKDTLKRKTCTRYATEVTRLSDIAFLSENNLSELVINSQSYSYSQFSHFYSATIQSLFPACLSHDRMEFIIILGKVPLDKCFPRRGQDVVSLGSENITRFRSTLVTCVRHKIFCSHNDFNCR